MLDETKQQDLELEEIRKYNEAFMAEAEKKFQSDIKLLIKDLEELGIVYDHGVKHCFCIKRMNKNYKSNSGRNWESKYITDIIISLNAVKDRIENSRGVVYKIKKVQYNCYNHKVSKDTLKEFLMDSKIQERLKKLVGTIK